METIAKYLVVLHSGSVLGASLLSNIGKPGGAKYVFISGKDRHPAILCTQIDVGSVAPFVVLTQPTHPGDPESSHRVLWVPSMHIVLVHERAQEATPIGFASS